MLYQIRNTDYANQEEYEREVAEMKDIDLYSLLYKVRAFLMDFENDVPSALTASDTIFDLIDRYDDFLRDLDNVQVITQEDIEK